MKLSPRFSSTDSSLSSGEPANSEPPDEDVVSDEEESHPMIRATILKRRSQNNMLLTNYVNKTIRKYLFPLSWTEVC
jgi:hypothetical protein